MRRRRIFALAAVVLACAVASSPTYADFVYRYSLHTTGVVAANPTVVPCTAAPTVLQFTGAAQTVPIPPGCTTATAKLWGAGGASGGGSSSGSAPAGGSGFTSGSFPVTQSMTLVAIVGGGGVPEVAFGATARGGFGGGGQDSSVGCGFSAITPSGSGGGLSGLFAGTVTQSGALLIAGGGGGSLAGNGASGGAGGGLSGQAGGGLTVTGGGAAGLGGAQIAGGLGGDPQNFFGGGGSSGSALQGGSGDKCGRPGGGGGYFGGGGGDNDTLPHDNLGGAGGGSGFVGNGATGITTAGSGPIPAGIGDPDYQPGIGVGAPAGSAIGGGNGRIVIRWN